MPPSARAGRNRLRRSGFHWRRQPAKPRLTGIYEDLVNAAGNQSVKSHANSDTTIAPAPAAPDTVTDRPGPLPAGVL
ncbi:MAG: hypothetical protein QOH05_1132 [Acetobacteraceae bacterium]|nr:hypothetical protein [Acetobacteraceae bacterium]